MAEKVAQAMDGGVGRGGIFATCKGKDAKTAIYLADMAELNRLGVGETDHRRGMKARADQEPSRQMLVIGFAADDRPTIMRRRAGGVAPMPDEIALGLGRIGGLASCLCLRVEDRGPFAI